MEGPSNTAFRFPLNRDTRFFLCRRCRNHVQSINNCLYIIVDSQAVICQNPVNVWLDTIMLRMFINHQPVMNVCCNECNVNLGQMFVTVTPPDYITQDGRIILYLKKLLLWTGTSLLYADTVLNN